MASPPREQRVCDGILSRGPGRGKPVADEHRTTRRQGAEEALMRIHAVAFGMLALSMSALVTAARAQDKYPSRPIDVIVPWGTGGGADSMARQLAALSQPHLGVALPISNV